ncbi:DUF732 domain-containing protein [Streptomyces sp. NPDC059631]|uniref:DUF732 domain-containing protein n=1 Tax=Streptomyces sp. NPDC059631 TaxID=3346890 RepID=UPI003697F4D9
MSYGIHDVFSEDSEPAPGPIAVEEGHHYNAYQETFLKAVRPLEYPPGVTEKDALFAALGVCATLKDDPVTDAAILAHNTSEDIGLSLADGSTFALAAEAVFCPGGQIAVSQ